MNESKIDKPKGLSRKAFILPVLMMTVGFGWLLTSLNSDINWIWTSCLGVIGIMTFVVSGIDKFSVVVGPFFLTASFMSIMRQLDLISLNSEVPFLVIVLGFFLAIAQFPVFKTPDWMKDSR